MRTKNWLTLGLSLVATLAFIGCSGGNDYKEVSDKDLVPVEEHGHEHAAPHGGLLAELGEHEYNVELVVDDGVLTVYLLDAHAENPVAVKADAVQLTLEVAETETPVVLKAVPQEGEADGMASQFVSDGPLPEAITKTADLHGDFAVMIGEKNYSAHLHGDEAHDHDHDDHDHAKEKE